MTYDKIRLEVTDRVAIITLTDPQTLNAADLAMAEQLEAALRSLADGEPQARALIITGEGRGFCSGANLTTGGASRTDPPSERDTGAGLESHYNPMLSRLRDFPLPIVTAINGAAAGIGCSLALMGDLIVAGESAYFLQAFRRIGLVPDGGSTYLLPRMIGRARAMEMVLLGDRVPASQAETWGLINRCVPDADLLTEATALAKRLADGPYSLTLTRRLMWESLDAEWKAQLHAERNAQTVAGRSQDSREGVLAFVEKRPANFSGR